MTKSGDNALRLVTKLYDFVPAFTDIFDEDTFQVFAVCFVLTTCLVALILSRYVTIKAVD